jgi:trans-2-enoyl-CoA reductase
MAAMLATFSRHATAAQIAASRRLFSSTTFRSAHRALVYTGKGDPSALLRAVTFADLPAAPRGTVNIRFLAAPINPSDLNVIEGVYPSRPSDATVAVRAATQNWDGVFFVAGNEGIAEVVDVGEGAGVTRGDWGAVVRALSTWYTLTMKPSHCG